MKITGCRVNHLINPIGYAMDRPVLSWKVRGAEGKRAVRTHVWIGQDPEFKTICFDSGDLKEVNALAFETDLKCEPYRRYYWKVEVESDAGEKAVSETQYFEMAKMDRSWEAEWIGCPELETENPVFEKRFTTDEKTDARLYITGLGLYEVFLDGVRIGNELLAPGCTDYNQWIQYQTYELPLSAGSHRLSVSLGNGWYKGRFGLSGGKCVYGDAFALIAEIRSAGTLLVKTDGSWKVCKGDIRENSIYDGEIWEPGSGEDTLYPVTLLEKDKKILSERYSVPVRIHTIRKPQQVLITPKGECVLDFGQNMSGFVRFRAKEEKGTHIELQYGEVLQQGCFYNENLRTAKAAYIYVSDGEEHQICPRFTFYGFRYVKVTGITRPAEEYEFEACAISSELEETGRICTGHEKVNQLLSNISWGLLDNYVDIPTDCPQRDERLGWTGDTQVFSASACFLRNSYPFLRKAAHDTWETQKELGWVTNVIPAFEDTKPTCAAWGDTATIVPWNLYQFYGDGRILEEQYDSMKNWADYMYHDAKKGDNPWIWSPEFGFGDWLAMDHDNPKERMLGGTDLAYISTAYYYYSTLLTAKAGEILGRTEAAMYRERAEHIKNSFQEEFLTPNGRLAVTTQTAYILALYMELIPKEYIGRTARDLQEKLERGGGYLRTGFVGTPFFCQVLSKYGYHKDACSLLLNEGVPSWLYAVNLGATTVWERWNSMLPDGTVNGTDMNSFNHYAYGSVVEWMYRYLAGIQPLEPGFAKARIVPMPDKRLKELHMQYDSAAGLYRVDWEYRPDRTLYLRVEIPFGAEAEVELPFESTTHLLQSGRYEWMLECRKKKGDDLPATMRPFKEVRNNSEARPILEQYVPGYENVPEAFCKDSLRVIGATPYFSVKEETLNELDDLLADIEF